MNDCVSHLRIILPEGLLLKVKVKVKIRNSINLNMVHITVKITTANISTCTNLILVIWTSTVTKPVITYPISSCYVGGHQVDNENNYLAVQHHILHFLALKKFACKIFCVNEWCELRSPSILCATPLNIVVSLANRYALK